MHSPNAFPVVHASEVAPFNQNNDSLFPSRVQMPPKPLLINDQEFFIDKIVDERCKRKQTEYRVRWQGEGLEDDKWLPASELEDRLRLTPADPPIEPLQRDKAGGIRVLVGGRVTDLKLEALRSTIFLVSLNLPSTYYRVCSSLIRDVSNHRDARKSGRSPTTSVPRLPRSFSKSRCFRAHFSLICIVPTTHLYPSLEPVPEHLPISIDHI